MESAERLDALVVEDDAEFLNALCEYLSSDGNWRPPHRAGDGAEAMALLADGLVPDLVLLDLELPKVHGQKILSHLRADPRFRRTVVVVTGADGDPGRDRDLFLPGEVWLAKPFRMDDLAFTVRLAISRLAQVEVDQLRPPEAQLLQAVCG